LPQFRRCKTSNLLAAQFVEFGCCFQRKPEVTE
jgi:hypothetical protein